MGWAMPAHCWTPSFISPPRPFGLMHCVHSCRRSNNGYARLSRKEDRMSEAKAAYLTAEDIAQLLEESNVLLIKKSIRVIGGTRVEALLEQALHIEAHGGMLTNDNSRRRTPGGTFFALMRDAVSR